MNALALPTTPADTYAPDVRAIAGRLSPKQREAIIECVDALDALTGEGFVVAEEAIFNLATAFNMPSDLEYGEWIRAHLKETSGE